MNLWFWNRMCLQNKMNFFWKEGAKQPLHQQHVHWHSSLASERVFSSPAVLSLYLLSDERAHESQNSRYLLPGLDVEVVVALTNPQNCEAQLPEVKEHHHESRCKTTRREGVKEWDHMTVEHRSWVFWVFFLLSSILHLVPFHLGIVCNVWLIASLQLRCAKRKSITIPPNL